MPEIPRSEILELLNSIYPFRRMDAQLVDQVADRLEVVSFNRDEYLYQEGEVADQLYIVYSGQVRITVTMDDAEEMLATLGMGDFFGEEVLEAEGYRLTSAHALEDVLLLRFKENEIAFLAENIPDFAEALELMLRSFRLTLRVRFDWLSEQENIYYLARRHPIFLIIRLALLGGVGGLALSLLLFFNLTMPGGIPLTLLALGVVAFAFVVIWLVVDYMNDYSIITNQRVVFSERIVLFYDSRIESPLTAIQSVTTETSLLGRQLDYGDVVVKTYTGTIVLPDVRDPGHVSRIVEADWYRARLSRRQTEKEMMERKVREIVGERVEPPQGLAQEKRLSMPAEQEQSWINSFLSNLFAMRFDFDGNIIYRKHWWVLLKNIWLPTLLLGLLFAIFLYSVLWPAAIISAVAGIALLLVGLLIVGAWWLYEYYDWRNDYFMVTDEQILDVNKKPLAREERRVAPLRNILSIEFQRLGLIGLILNFGTVYIRVGDTQLTFDEVFNPSGVQQDLFNRLADRLYKDRLAEIDQDQERIAGWLDTYHRYTQDNPPQNPPS